MASEAVTRAAKIGGRADLRHVRLWRLHIDQHHDVPREGTWDVDLDIKVSQSLNDTDLVVEVKYALTVDMSEAEQQRGYAIATSWLLYYELRSAEGLEHRDCESFAVISGVFAAHPYQRELVQRLTGQMGFEPLVLSVLRSPTDIRAGEDYEIGTIDEDIPPPPV